MGDTLIEYAIKDRPKGWVDSNDIGCSEMPKTCQNFKCQKWEDRDAVAPVLRVNPKGFMVCPRCLGSYGKAG